MRRRNLLFMALLGAAGWPRRLRAQAVKGIIGYLHPITTNRDHATFSMLAREWRRLGYVDGETLLARSAEGNPQLLPELARDLAGRGVGVIIAVGADAVRAAVKATDAIPIVAIDLETDPVKTGLVESYARPGGKVTGLFLDMPLLAGKWIELMREMVPNLERVAFAWQPSTGRGQLDVALAVARDLGIEATVLELGLSNDFSSLLETVGGSGRRTGVILLTFPGFFTVADKFSAAAERHHVTTMSFLAGAARRGVLMSYGPSQEDYFPRAAHIADRILRGDRVAEVPIERPSKFEFVINLRTARRLGLTVPPALLYVPTKPSNRPGAAALRGQAGPPPT